jgi:outer membrane protein assembly factor BamA
MQNFMWTGGMMSSGMMVGSSTYSYQSNGGNVTMQYPITLNPRYTITANYTSLVSEVFPPRNMIMWSGTWQNGTIAETGYSFTP